MCTITIINILVQTISQMDQSNQIASQSRARRGGGVNGMSGREEELDVVRMWRITGCCYCQAKHLHISHVDYQSLAAIYHYYTNECSERSAARRGVEVTRLRLVLK